MKKRALFLAVAMLIAALAPAQQFNESVQVTVVEVPVTVVDRAGKAVAGLTKEDFEITDDGKKVNLVGFETIDMSKLVVDDNATPLPPAAYRNFLLLFDLANSSPGTLGRARIAAREFVGRQLGRRDLAAVATFSVEHGLQIVTGFTSDRATLEHAVSTLGSPKYFKVADPLRITAGKTSSVQGGQARPNEPGAEIAIEELIEKSELAGRANDEDLRGRLRRQFSQFANVARMLDTLRGQKQIILLSEGFDAKHVTGQQDLSFESTQKQNDAVLSGEVWKVDTDARYGSATSSSEITQMAEIFRRSDVTLHAIDIKGLRSDVDASEGVKKSSNEALYLLTRPTGGSVFKNATALSDNFAQLLQQQETVYLLAFEAKPDKAGKFHKLSVKVPKVRGARINHRSGYYEDTGKLSPLQQTMTLADIMMTDADVRDVPFTVSALTLPARDGSARLPVIVEIPGAGLLEKVTGNSVNVTVFVYAFDEQYQIKDFLQQRIGFDLAKSGDQLRKAGMRYVGMLNVPPGKYAVKALARVEETGRVGFVRTDLDVAASSGPAILAPVFVNDRTGWINIAEPGKGANAAAAFTAAGKPFAPQTGPVLKSDGAYRVALFVHDTPAENLEITPAIINADGSSQNATVTLVGRTPPDDQGGAKLLFEFKPAQVAAGTYKLQLTVKPQGGQASVVAVPFSVQ
jgi:VWFA-related protein